jgi:hypothetical protein
MVISFQEFLARRAATAAMAAQQAGPAPVQPGLVPMGYGGRITPPYNPHPLAPGGAAMGGEGPGGMSNPEYLAYRFGRILPPTPDRQPPPPPTPMAPLPGMYGRPPADPFAGVTSGGSVGAAPPRPLAPLPGMYGRPPAPPPIPHGQPVLTGDPRIDAPIIAAWQQRGAPTSVSQPAPASGPMFPGQGRPGAPLPPPAPPPALPAPAENVFGLTGDPRIDGPRIAALQQGGQMVAGQSRPSQGGGPVPPPPDRSMDPQEQREAQYSADLAQSQYLRGEATAPGHEDDPTLTEKRDEAATNYDLANAEYNMNLALANGQPAEMVEGYVRQILTVELGREPTPLEVANRTNAVLVAPLPTDDQIVATQQKREDALTQYYAADGLIVYYGGQSAGDIGAGLVSIGWNLLDEGRQAAATGIGELGYQIATGSTTGDVVGAVAAAGQVLNMQPDEYLTWIDANKTYVQQLHENGYDSDGDGRMDYYGGRAVWEAWIGTQPKLMRALIDIGIDPLNYLGLLGLGGKALQTAGRARGAAATTRGGQLTGALMDVGGTIARAPTQLLDAPVDAVIGGAVRGVRGAITPIATGLRVPDPFAPTARGAARETTQTAVDTAAELLGQTGPVTGGEAGIGPPGAAPPPTAPTTPAPPDGSGRAVTQSNRTVTERRVDGKLQWDDPASGYTIIRVQEPTERVLPGREGTVTTQGVYVLYDPNGVAVGTYGSTDEAWRTVDAAATAYGDTPAPGDRIVRQGDRWVAEHPNEDGTTTWTDDEDWVVVRTPAPVTKPTSPGRVTEPAPREYALYDPNGEKVGDYASTTEAWAAVDAASGAGPTPFAAAPGPRPRGRYSPGGGRNAPTPATAVAPTPTNVAPTGGVFPSPATAAPTPVAAVPDEIPTTTPGGTAVRRVPRADGESYLIDRPGGGASVAVRQEADGTWRLFDGTTDVTPTPAPLTRDAALRAADDLIGAQGGPGDTPATPAGPTVPTPTVAAVTPPIEPVTPPPGTAVEEPLTVPWRERPPVGTEADAVPWPIRAAAGTGTRTLARVARQAPEAWPAIMREVGDQAERLATDANALKRSDPTRISEIFAEARFSADVNDAVRRHAPTVQPETGALSRQADQPGGFRLGREATARVLERVVRRPWRETGSLRNQLFSGGVFDKANEAKRGVNPASAARIATGNPESARRFVETVDLHARLVPDDLQMPDFQRAIREADALVTALREAGQDLPDLRVVGAGPIQGGPADASLLPTERPDFFSVPIGAGTPPTIESVTPPPGEVVRQGDAFAMTDPTTGQPMVHATEAEARAHAALVPQEQIVPVPGETHPANLAEQARQEGIAAQRGDLLAQAFTSNPDAEDARIASWFDTEATPAQRKKWVRDTVQQWRGLGQRMVAGPLVEGQEATGRQLLDYANRIERANRPLPQPRLDDAGNTVIPGQTSPGALPGAGPNLPGEIIAYLRRPVTPTPAPGIALDDSPVQRWRGEIMTQAQADALNVRLQSTGETAGEFISRELDRLGKGTNDLDVLPEIGAAMIEAEMKAAGHEAPLIGGMLKLWDGFSRALSAMTRLGPASMVRYIFMQFIGNPFSLVMAGHPEAALRSLSVKNTYQTFKYIRGTGDLPEYAARLLDPLGEKELPQWLLDLPRDEMGALTRRGQDTVLKRIGLDWASPFEQALKGAFAPQWAQDLARAADTQARITQWVVRMEKGLPEAASRTASNTAERARRLGLNPIEARAIVEGLGAPAGAVGTRGTRGAMNAKTLNAVMEDFARRGGLGEKPARDFADRVVRDWRNALDGTKKAAKAETRRVLFGAPETNLDAIVRRIFFFHYWNSRASVLYTREAIRHPGIINAYVKGLEEAREMSEDDNAPPWLKGWLKLADSPLGLSIFLNPWALVTTSFMGAEGEDERGWWGQFVPMLHPALDMALYAIGGVNGYQDKLTGRPSDIAPALPGIGALSRHLTAAVNLGRAYLSDDAPVVYDPARQALPWLREQLTGEAQPNPTATAESTFNTFVIDAGRKLGYTDEQIAAAMNDPSDEAYREAYRDWSKVTEGTELWRSTVPVPVATRGETRDDLMTQGRGGTEGSANPFGPAGDAAYQQAFGMPMPEGYSPYAGGDLAASVSPQDAAFLRGYQAATGVWLNEQNFADAWASREAENLLYQAANAGSPEARTLGMEQDAYHALGTPQGQYAQRMWTDIAYGPIVGRVVVGGNTYTEDDIADYRDAQVPLVGEAGADELVQQLRYSLADAWLTQAGLVEERDALRAQREEFIGEHPVYARYDAWSRSARNYEGGITGWWLDVIPFNESAEAFYDEAIAEGLTGADLERRLASRSAYLAVIGEREQVFDPTPPPANTAGYGMPGPGATTGAPSGSGAGVSTDTAVGIAQDLAEYEAARAVGASILPGPNWQPFGPWGEAMQANMYAQAGYEPPELGGLALEYVQWTQGRAANADNSIIAFLADRAAGKTATEATYLPWLMGGGGADVASRIAPILAGTGEPGSYEDWRVRRGGYETGTRVGSSGSYPGGAVSGGGYEAGTRVR